mmetsp:Transcript_20617/g.23831  ORF Transcript_20617/g.23831 Transcript_20617/m.23831 type:complete len:135 (+) Transcript_20617:3171-3575(+)
MVSEILQWSKKLKSSCVRYTGKCRPHPFPFKKLEGLEKEASKLTSDSKAKCSEVKAFSLISEEFYRRWLKAKEWMTLFEEFNREVEDAKEDDERLWTMQELERLISIASECEVVPMEYKDFQVTDSTLLRLNPQ